MFDDVDAGRARSIVESALRAGRSQPKPKRWRRCSAATASMAASAVVDGAGSAARAAQSIGYRSSSKVDAGRRATRNDVGGVAIDLADAQAVRAAVSDMQGRLSHLGALRFQVPKFVSGDPGTDRRRDAPRRKRRAC
ncbi:MAG: acetate--CoA ligase family protein [Ideonella sp.]|nr:acetate--CoA ligase family protein [Ideonella sp.]